jgi:hypothetical protein
VLLDKIRRESRASLLCEHQSHARRHENATKAK